MSSTEYCAVRTFIGASVWMKSLEHPDLQSAQKKSEMMVELAQA